MNKAIIKAVYHINAQYSKLWIAATHTDKWTYRDKSRVHNALISIGFHAAKKIA